MIITVVTPTLNGSAYLRECIESVRQNRRPHFEIDHVIVDAGSTDGTVEIARSFGLRIIEGKDKGIFDAINKGSFNSRGDLLGFIGSDDVMLDGALEAVADAYSRSQRGWIVGGIRWIDEDGRSLGEFAAPPVWMTPRMHVCLRWNPIMHMSTYFSRDFFGELSGFDIGFKDAGDYEMFARALVVAPYVRIPRPLSCFRRTGQNNSVVNSVRATREWKVIFQRFGPRTRWEEAFWRHFLRAWFNGRNPRWLMAKVMTSLRVRLKLQESPYF